MKTQLDNQKIDGLLNQTLAAAQAGAVELLNEFSFKNGAKKVRLLQDIGRARSATEIVRILYYTILAGEGLSVTNSTWQKNFA